MKHRLRATLCLVLLFAVNCGRAADFEIDAAFPGGNITVDRVEGEAVFLRQDLRDTLGDWFYWAFRVRGAAGRTLRFTFASDKFAARGPAISTDGGITWRWLGREVVKDRTFSHSFAPDAGDVRFSMGMPYTEANLKRFLQRHAADVALRTGTLCRTLKGRTVELLRFGQLEGEPRLRVFFTARHHACEMMANGSEVPAVCSSRAVCTQACICAASATCVGIQRHSSGSRPTRASPGTCAKASGSSRTTRP